VAGPDQLTRAGDAASEIEGVAFAGRSQLQLAWTRLRHDRVAVTSTAVIVVLVLLAICAPLVAKVVGWGPDAQDRQHGLTPDGLPVGPSTMHWLGTDNLGRDVLVRAVYGARVSLVVGLGATALATLIGVAVGVVAGYASPGVDTGLSRLMDVVLCFPFLLFAIALVSVVGPSLNISIIVIAFFSWASIGRVIRGQTLTLREHEFVEAARSTGAKTLRIMTVEILPNLVSPILVLATVIIPTAIVFEATLSFLGLGVEPPTPTWGNMISDSLPYYNVAWWFVAAPGVGLLLMTLAFNLLGDSVRDALDPNAARMTSRKVRS
jgi:peptide/nickel transport system permease protein